MTSPHDGSEPISDAEGAALDPRRKRARFRAWHRGTREMDLIMGRFADHEIARLDEAQLREFERLLDEAEADVFAWVTGGVERPAGFDGALLDRLARYRGHTL